MQLALMQIGGQEMAPVIVWGGLGLMALGALGKAVSAVGGPKKKAEGKWVYDRSLGGKKVWVPAEGTSEGASARPAISDADLSKLSSIAAAAGSVKEVDTKYESPSW
jgi:hypothetical protein